MVSKKVAELQGLVDRDPRAASIVELWTRWDDQMYGKLAEWRELRSFIFATDTTTTTNSTLPWKNKTTLPKLTQIRDNLHANYMSTLLPSDNWLKWEAYTEDDADKEKARIIQTYLTNKLRDSESRLVTSQLLYDYIDYGNAFSDVEYVNESYTDPVTGEQIPGYIGPRLVRISPYDIRFNPLASSFKDSPNIVRRLTTIGDVMAEMESLPEHEVDEKGIEKIKEVRAGATGYSKEDFNKAFAYAIDGFGNLADYYNSGMVELLVFEGDFFDPTTGELHKGEEITVADRSHVVRRRKIPNWFGKTLKNHVAWRKRPDNLWGMGPLDNLVGMQYRIDHLENLKADVFDLIGHPPLKIRGLVEDFTWGPGEEIYCGDGDVEMLVPDTTALNADTQIQLLENKMEEFAGAPRQAMGIRTPGEKTAFEVQTLQNAASRIFQEKIRSFEIELLEPALNGMLEVARRNMDASDVIRVMDDDIGVTEFMEITKEDITAKGKLRPVGARHFAQQAQLVQTLNNIANSNLLPIIQNHVSSKKLAFLLENVLELERFDLVGENVGVLEQADTQRLIQQIQEDLATEAATPTEEPTGGGAGGGPSAEEINALMGAQDA